MVWTFGNYPGMIGPAGPVTTTTSCSVQQIMCPMCVAKISLGLMIVIDRMLFI